MELNPLGVFAILGGVILLYSGIKNKFPQDVIREALGKPALKGPIMPSGQARKLDGVADTSPNAGTVIATV
jgi:hypothetical protein